MRLFQRIKSKFHSDDPQQLKREIKWLFKYIKRYWVMLAIGVVLSFVGTVMGLCSSVASKYLIDAVTGYNSDMLLPSAIAMIVLMLGSLALQAFSSRISAVIHVKVKKEMQCMTYSKILRTDWEALEPYRSGDLLNRLNSDVSVVSDGVISFIPNMVSGIVRFVGAFVIMLCYDPTMALIALLGVPVTLVLSGVLTRRMRKHNLTMKELTGEVMSFQEDSFRNLTGIKAFSIIGRFEDKMKQQQDKYVNAYLSYNSFQIWTTSFLSLVGMVVTAGCFGWGVYRLWTGQITYGSMTLFLQLASVLRSSFSALVSLLPSAISITTSAGRIMAVEDLLEEDAQIPEDFANENQYTVSLKQVSFEYKGSEIILNPFDFTASPGDLIAITGPSGEGKTTLLRILLGLVQPHSGSAQLIGQTGKAYTITAGTRSAFSYVPQGNSIFAGTVAENLRMICPEATDEQLMEALKIACADEFVSQLPDGLEHKLGSSGRGISEGQAQRLAIARALLCKAPIMLLDEATSALDMETERRLLNNLQSCDLVKTCIVVTHRQGSADFCTRNYEIKNGNIIEVHHGA